MPALQMMITDAGLDAIVNDKDGRFQQYRITRVDGRFGAVLARSWRLASQPEGCVADERTGLLFMGEEKRGLWVAEADPAKPMTSMRSGRPFAA